MRSTIVVGLPAKAGASSVSKADDVGSTSGEKTWAKSSEASGCGLATAASAAAETSASTSAFRAASLSASSAPFSRRSASIRASGSRSASFFRSSSVR